MILISHTKAKLLQSRAALEASLNTPWQIKVSLLDKQPATQSKFFDRFRCWQPDQKGVNNLKLGLLCIDLWKLNSGRRKQ